MAVVDDATDPNAFKVGDEVYGMLRAERGRSWAEYAIFKTHEASLKPKALSWKQAAALPLSALTADRDLFTHAGLDFSHITGKDTAVTTYKRRVLITGSSGGVGAYFVQFA